MNEEYLLENSAVVIDDGPGARSLLTTTLERAGFNVHSAVTATAGMELVRLHSPAVTTLDIDIPGVDGFEVVRRIRSVSETYLVVVTARSSESDMLLGYQSGADCYLTKPFRPLELRARIAAMLKRPRMP